MIGVGRWCAQLVKLRAACIATVRVTEYVVGHRTFQLGTRMKTIDNVVLAFVKEVVATGGLARQMSVVFCRQMPIGAKNTPTRVLHNEPRTSSRNHLWLTHHHANPPAPLLDLLPATWH